MSEVFFFEKEPVWRQYLNELGIQASIDRLKAGGHPHEWPLKVADPNDKLTFFRPKGKGFRCYESSCPNYVGYYLDGLYGAVKCENCPDLLPGGVVESICKKDFTKCPFFKERKENCEQSEM